jgi:DNA-binding MarR family transcriptional regulator
MVLQPRNISVSRYLTLLYLNDNYSSLGELAEFLGVTESEANAELIGMRLSGLVDIQDVHGSRRGRTTYALTTRSEELVQDVSEKLAKVG